MKIRFASFLAVALLLAACKGVTPPTSTTAATTPPVSPEMPGAVTAPTAPLPESALAELGPRPAMSDNKAVVALLDRAQTDNTAGKREAAGASLERALRIEPRNPWLWHELAQVRLDEGQYAQAITLARKSNSFAGGQHRVQAENWQLIGKARVAQGDAAGAEQAFKQAEELAKQAKAEAGPASDSTLH